MSGMKIGGALKLTRKKKRIRREISFNKLSLSIPKYQWTAIDPKTRIRFLSWSFNRDWSCGQVFLKMVVWWLRLFGFNLQGGGFWKSE
jgi:hypothetical protein